MIQRAYRYRIYPNAAQRRLLSRDFAAGRFAWNACLAWRSHGYTAHGERLTGVDFSRELTWLKTLEPYAWLNATNSSAQTQKLRDLDAAFTTFFAKRARYPRFKNRHGAQSARYQLDQRQVHRMYLPGQLLKLPKVGALKVRWSRLPSGIPKMVTVTRDAAGRWFAAFGIEERLSSLPATGLAVGIDVGVKDVFVTSAGVKSGNPQKLRRRLRHLKRQQRSLSRKHKGSSRWQRQKIRVARLHAKIADSRRDWLHKRSTEIVRGADVIALEDLHVKGMLRNRRLARSLSDASLGELRRQIDYKAGWYGRQVLYAGRFTPTSKTCGGCGHVLAELKLSTRRWVCPACGTDHDRDINAARNILSFATASSAGSGQHAQSAWSGKDPAMPVAQAARTAARVGRSSVSREARTASGVV